MCKLGLVFLISLLTGNNYAQGHFVLLQSDNRQPFYVRLGAQRYNSSPDGHLILAPLKDSSYTIAIGFAAQPGIEQTYAFGTPQKDQELLIRDSGETGWGLFDPQAKEWMTVIARSGGREEVRAIGVRRDDAFSRLMAGVVRDTAVLYNDYAGADLGVSRSDSASVTKPDTATASLPAPTRSDTGSAIASTPELARSETAAQLSASQLPAAQPSTQLPAAQPSAGQFPVGRSSVSRSSPSQPSAGQSPARQSPTSQSSIGQSSVGRSSPGQLPAQLSATQPSASHPSVGQPTAGQPTAGQPSAVQSSVDRSSAENPDTVSINPVPLHRPNAGSSQHKSPPVVDTQATAPTGPQYPPIPGVLKLSEKRLTRNMRLVYADKDKGAKPDTVVVMIPLDTPQAVAAKLRPANLRPTNPDSARIAKGTNGPDSPQTAKTRAAANSTDSTQSAKT
ncbi:MAG TPA: hypothetical protein VNW04_14655, partial [Puia sp.]|nr:hypothetical protein [Puia sp.]